MGSENIKSAGPSWDDVRKELFTPEEIQASDKRVGEIKRERLTKPVK